MARKQNKKSHLTKRGNPVKMVSTSANSNDSIGSHIENADLPDKHRRTSILITDGDEALPHNKSVDDAISSMAKPSASFTDEKILRKSLVVEDDEIKEHLKDLEKESEHEPSEVVIEGNENAYGDDCVEPNQFEEAIKKNKLDIDDQTLGGDNEDDELNISPKTTSNEGKQLGFGSKDKDAQDSATDIGELASQDNKSTSFNNDPITLVGDKRKSELQEYIPETGFSNDFTPTQEDLVSTDKEKEENESEVAELSKKDCLPWESETLTDAKLPWETDDTNSDNKFAGLLPWECNESNVSEVIASHVNNDEHSRESETNDTTSASQIGDKNSWKLGANDDMLASQTDKLPWESEGTNNDIASQMDNDNKHSNKSTDIDNLFGNSHDNEFLNEIQKQKETIYKDEVLLGSSDNVKSVQYSPENQNTFQPDISRSEEHSLFASQFANGSQENNENGIGISDSSKPQEKDHLEELFQNDDDDFLQDVSLPDNKGNLFEFPPKNNTTEVKDDEKSGSINKSLDFLELDDDLLDDEFLEDESTDQKSVVQTNPNKQTYLPSRTQASSVKTAPQENQKPTINKKKSDAYDFPDSLIAHKFKPAARTTNKYAPGSSSHGSPPVSNMPPKISSSTSTVGVPGDKETTVPKSVDSIHSSQKKSFFEDLPMPIQKQPVKPARAALPRAQTNQSISPIVKSAQPQLQKPVVNPYAKPAMNVVKSPSLNYAPLPPPISNNRVGPQVPTGIVAPPPPSTFTGNNNTLSQTQPQAFPNLGLGQNANSFAAQGASNLPPNLINTAIPKVQGSQSATSPYVPNAGPYAPSSHKRTLSRASSLIGAKNKEGNPYAPASINVPNTQQGMSQGLMMPNTASPTALSAVMHNNIHGRRRGTSNVKSNFYHKEQIAPKVENPNALLQRQFPIFNWSSSKNVAYLIPSTITNTYSRTSESINVTDIKEVLKDSHHLLTFPGPLSKLKSKKKDVEKWLETYNESLAQDNTGKKLDELLLSQILLSLVKFNGDSKCDDFSKAACAFLNPSVDYNNANTHMDINSMSAIANAYRLDNAGINIVWGLLQIGNTEKALEFCLSKGDWALALMIANFDGPEKFGKIASDYARSTFPYQKSQSKVHHLMPIMLKLFAGNYKSAIDDITNVHTEGEWFIHHWRDLVSLIVINKPQQGHEFLCEFSKLLALSGQIIPSQICLILTGLPLSNVPSQANGILFSVIGFGSHSFAYSEIYEYAIQLCATNIPPTGFAHLLPLKLKHAQVLADYGLFVESQKYCDAISSIIKATGRSSFFNPVAFQEFQNLLMRISQSSSTDLGWFGSKKLNLDKMWDQLDKFIGGDESKAKSGENGVFSKFSPSVSRAPSSLDITSMNNNHPQSLPQGRADQIRDSLIAANSAPGTSSENSILKLNGMPHTRPPPSLYSNNSTTSIHKYAPPSSQVASRPVLARNDQLFSSQQQVANPVYESLQQSRMVPNNPSSQYLPINQGQSESIKAPSKYSPNPLKVYSNNNGSFSYMNSSAQFSSLSIASHQSLHMGISSTNMNPPAPTKRPSISNSFSENHVNSNSIPGHKHTSSLQSDISLDYPTEFKSMPKVVNDNSAFTDVQPDLKKDAEYVPETITELRESEKSSEFNDTSIPLSTPQTIDENHSTVEELTNSTLPQAPPPPKGQMVPKLSSAAPKKARVRANPYAPGAVASRNDRNNKYGPSSNKYASKKEGSSLLVDTPSDISYNDIFNLGGYKVPEKSEIDENKKSDTENDTKKITSEEVTETKEEILKGPLSLQPGTPNVGPSRTGIANVDESFDSEGMNDHEFETSSLHTPKARPPFSSHLNNTFKTHEKETMFHPYQDNEDKTRRDSGFGVDSSFGDFPIPGSPDLTTRANSVIGGPSGLFSSRLSQSQQSALYQQYEVEDDTVKDYIPVVDEEDEDSDEESAKKEKKKREEQERRARIEADRTRQKQEAAASQRNQPWWPFARRRNDDKPKPIRAKLGEKNKLVWDEKLKRWIDKSIPLEEQLKSSAPPPPPAAKKKPVDSSSSSLSKPPSSSTQIGPSKQETGSSAQLSNCLNGAPLTGPSQTRPSNSGPPPPAGPSLANAGLDDLLSLGGPSTGRKTKKGPRRGYVNLLDQK